MRSNPPEFNSHQIQMLTFSIIFRMTGKPMTWMLVKKNRRKKRRSRLKVLADNSNVLRRPLLEKKNWRSAKPFVEDQLKQDSPAGVRAEQQ
jgi:hypothetical protein